MKGRVIAPRRSRSGAPDPFFVTDWTTRTTRGHRPWPFSAAAGWALFLAFGAIAGVERAGRRFADRWSGGALGPRDHPGPGSSRHSSTGIEYGIDRLRLSRPRLADRPVREPAACTAGSAMVGLGAITIDLAFGSHRITAPSSGRTRLWITVLRGRKRAQVGPHGLLLPVSGGGAIGGRSRGARADGAGIG